MIDDAIALAERILQILDQGAFTSTYKYAVLLGLLDLCLERTSPDGTPPGEITTRQLAEKVVEIYWHHTLDYLDAPAGPAVLLQSQGRRGTQAEIVKHIERFRSRHVRDETLPLPLARIASPDAYVRLLDLVEWKLIEMPLPRLQVVGGRPDPFLYEIAWNQGVRRAPISDYQSGRTHDFDNRIRLFPDVAAHLVALNGLLRPLIQRQWAQDVARINRLPEATLQAFLFGTPRTATRAVRTALVELQHGACFYCGRSIHGYRESEVDHFIPWARHPDDGIENLVVADRACNNDKRAHLAATTHVERWLERLSGPRGRDLAAIARNAGWESSPERTLGVATSIYLRLPEDFALWRSRGVLETIVPGALRQAFLAVR